MVRNASVAAKVTRQGELNFESVATNCPSSRLTKRSLAVPVPSKSNDQLQSCCCRKEMEVFGSRPRSHVESSTEASPSGTTLHRGQAFVMVLVEAYSHDTQSVLEYSQAREPAQSSTHAPNAHDGPPW